MYDFLSVYYPKLADLPAEQVATVRSRLGQLIREASPEVDTAPNSPFGDLHVTPAAYHVTAMEVAVNRILSDLDPENAAAGVVYNCEFVEAFLKTYGIYDENAQSSYGILRLQFSDRADREIDRSTLFKIGDYTYRPYLPRPGALRLLPAGIMGQPGENTASYHPYSAEAWVVDILVFGQAGTTATAGSAVEIDRVIDGLTGASALSDFRGGQSPGRVQELARQVRNNFYPRTPVSRGGAINMITQRFPEITTVAAVVSGDAEMARDINNPGQVAAGCIDVLVRSQTLLTDSVAIDLDWLPTEVVGGREFIGWLDLPETPVRILSVAHNGVEVGHTLFSVSADPRKPGLTAAYGKAERLLLRIPQTLDDDSNPVIGQVVDTEIPGRVYGRFTVTYQFDADLKAAQDFATGEENIPVGLDLYVRWFTPLVLQSLKVEFNRRAGVTLNLAQARADILQTYNAHTVDNPATPALIADAMLYAGAHSVTRVTMAGSIRFSVADRVWLGNTLVEPDDAGTWAAFLAQCEDVPTRDVTSAYEPELTYVDTENNTGAASGERNVSWLLDSSNLELKENRSV